MILLIDNYDSFVYNLGRYFRELGCETHVARNDRMTLNDVRGLDPAAIVLSPGPGAPRDAGVSIDVVRQLGPHCPILGICLGHQAIGEAYGGTVVRAAEPVHGRTSEILHSGGGLFDGLPNPLTATRYHSLIVDRETLPPELIVTARLSDGMIMGLAHRRHCVYGLQFHPESVLSECGHRMLANFLTCAGIATPPEIAGDFTAPPAAEAVALAQPLHW